MTAARPRCPPASKPYELYRGLVCLRLQGQAVIAEIARGRNAWAPVPPAGMPGKHRHGYDIKAGASWVGTLVQNGGAEM
jgi:hypothetical protein